MTSIDRPGRRGFRAIRLRPGLTGPVVTAMSLWSRVLSLLLLVPAARGLDAVDFGVFSLTMGLAIAAANVVGNAPADLTATAAAVAPGRTGRRAAIAIAITIVVGAAFAVGGALTHERGATSLLGVAIASSTAGPVFAMHLLRGRDRAVLGASLAFALLPLARMAAVFVTLETGGDLEQLLLAVSVSGLVVGVVALSVVVAVRPEGSSRAHRDEPRTSGRRMLAAVAAGASVSVAWMVLGQSGNLALVTVAGAAALAAFVPTARLCESLTAIGIGYKSAANRSLQATASGELPRRTVLILVASVASAGGAMFMVAPWGVPYLFGTGLSFLPLVALVLVGVAAVSSLIAIKVQLLFAAHRHLRVVVGSGVAAVSAVLSTGVGAVLWQAEGVAVGMLFTAVLWLAALVVRIPRQETPSC